jgi:hypothetical protein
LAAHAPSRDSARHPGDGLSARHDGRNVVDQKARKLTQPETAALVVDDDPDRANRFAVDVKWHQQPFVDMRRYRGQVGEIAQIGIAADQRKGKIDQEPQTKTHQSGNLQYPQRTER